MKITFLLPIWWYNRDLFPLRNKYVVFVLKGVNNTQMSFIFTCMRMIQNKYCVNVFVEQHGMCVYTWYFCTNIPICGNLFKASIDCFSMGLKANIITRFRGGGGHSHTKWYEICYPPAFTATYKMDPKCCIIYHVTFSPLNSVTSAKDNPKWRILIVMALKLIPSNAVLKMLLTYLLLGTPKVRWKMTPPPL